MQKKLRLQLFSISAGVVLLLTIGSRLLLPGESTHGMPAIADAAPTRASSQAETKPMAKLPEQKSLTKARALQILAKPLGFVPKEITRPAGDYYISIGNLSGVRELSLRLDREHGSKVREVAAKRDKPWKGIVHLTPGTYVLTEANHPEWVCRITIER